MYRTCIYCKSNKMSFFRKITGYTLVKCNNCSLIQTAQSGLKNRNHINQVIYSDEYLENYLKREKELKFRFYLRISEIEKYKKGGKILDIGCSIGLLLECIHEVLKGKWQLYGVDLNEKSIKVAKRRVKASLSVGTLTSTKYPSKFFDCITCFDVLEHDVNIKRTLQEIRRLLKDDGLLVIQSPNYKSVMANLSGVYWDWWSVPDHVIHFSKDTLIEVLRCNNFSISKWFSWEPEKDFVMNIAGSIRKSLPSTLFMNKILAKLSIFPLSILWRLIQIPERVLPIGGEIVVIARNGTS